MQPIYADKHTKYRLKKMEFFHRRPYRQIAQIALGNSMCKNIPITVSNSIKYAVDFCVFSSFADVIPYLSNVLCQYQFILNLFFAGRNHKIHFFLCHHSSELAILGIWSFKTDFLCHCLQSICMRPWLQPTTRFMISTE